MRHLVTRRSRLALPALGLGALTLIAGCNSASSPDQSSNEPGTMAQDPSTGRFFIVDQNASGLSAEVRILRVAWGRLVDVYGLDAVGKRVLMNEDFAIAPSLDTDGIDFLLETSPVTSAQSLTILRDVSDTGAGGGLAQFHDKLRQAEANIEPVFDKGLSGSGFFSMVPRNAVAIIQFDDLIDPTTLDGTTLRTVVGTPSVIPYEARLLIDKNHGDLANHDGKAGAEFYPSRVLIDMTVSEPESFEADPPLPVNTVGLPASVDANLSNTQLRIPTKLDPILGQDKILMNPSGHGLATANNGSIDYSSPFLDVARAFRSGGPEEVTQDPYNGFLPDKITPRIVGVLNGEVTSVTDDPNDTDPAVFRVDYTFDAEFCAQNPVPGDTLSQPGVFAEVIEPDQAQGAVVSGLKVRLVSYPSDWPNGPATWSSVGTGPTQYLAPYEHSQDQGRAGCFVSVSPPAPNPNEPTKNIESSATVELRFNEPMDPDRVNAFDAVTITRADPPVGSYDYIVGDLAHSIDLHKFRFLPNLPFAHQNGFNESYFMNVVPGNASPDVIAGPVDLAGNEILEVFPTVELVLNSVTFESKNGGRVSLFTSADEEPPFWDDDPDGEFATMGEWGGQHLYELARGVIRPRPVVHFQGIVDRSNNEIVGAMTGTLVGQQAPMSNFGSKAQLLWRYMDMGLGLYQMEEPFSDGDTKWSIDPTTFNIDVEGLSWAPFGGEVVIDSYAKFEIALSHTGFFPDESGTAASGLVDIYESNLLSTANDPLRIVHERFNGYSVNPGDIYVVNGSLRLIPFPMNVQVDPDEYRYYTFRDTSLRARAGDDTSGVPPLHYYTVTGERMPCLPDPNDNCSLDVCVFNPLYAPNEVQTIGLPLLMQFSCWPDDGAVGVNLFDTSSAVTTASFRGHTTGGKDALGQLVYVDPDLQDRANGGFDPANGNQPTPGNDVEVYMGAADFVTRISRSHSIWFPATDPSDPPPLGNPMNNTVYNPPTVLPGLLDQPLGTAVAFSFRGASNVQTDGNGNTDARDDARTLDLYGDHYLETPSVCDGSYTHNSGSEHNTGISFTNGGSMDWFDDINDINDSSWYQVRITWTSNPLTGLTPELTAFGLTWEGE